MPLGLCRSLHVAARALLYMCIACALTVPCAAGDGDPAPAVDARDIWRTIRHKESDEAIADQLDRPFLAIAPSITSKPSTGPAIGASTADAFMASGEDGTHVSTLGASARVSVRKQTQAGVRYGIFMPADRWYLLGDNRFQWTSLNVGALGVESGLSKTNLKYDWFRFYDTAYRRIGNTRLFAGAGININDHTNVRPGSATTAAFDRSAYVTYSAEHDLSVERQVSAGTNVALRFDTRDSAINAQHGWLASATFRTFFDGFLGGDTTWQELNLDVRTYRELTRTGRQKLAFWFLGDLVTGGVAPYFDLPAIAADTSGRSARGYGEGFFRGPHLLYGETEYRASLVPSGLLGMVAFVNVTTLDGESPNRRLLRSFAPGGGAGLRILLDKRSRTNLCADYAVGRDGSKGFYLAVQEAF